MLKLEAFVVTLLCVLFLCLQVEGATFQVLNAANFDQVVSESSTTAALVMFYAPWCGACKRAIPEVETAATYFPEDKITFGTVDGFRERILAMRYNVEKFPTLFYFKPGSTYAFTLKIQVKEEKIIEAIKENSLWLPEEPKRKRIKTTTKLTTVEDIVDLVRNHHKNVVAAFVTKDCREGCDIFEAVAKAFKNEDRVDFVRVDVQNQPHMIFKLKLSKNPSITYYPRDSNLVGDQYNYKGALNAEELVGFVNTKGRFSRTVGGSLHAGAGGIPEFDELIRKYIEDITDRRDYRQPYIIKKADKLLQKTLYESRFANYYITLINKIFKEGPVILSKERDRLSGVIKSSDKGSIRHDDAFKRRSIVENFIETASLLKINIPRSGSRLHSGVRGHQEL